MGPTPSEPTCCPVVGEAASGIGVRTKNREGSGRGVSTVHDAIVAERRERRRLGKTLYASRPPPRRFDHGAFFPVNSTFGLRSICSASWRTARAASPMSEIVVARPPSNGALGSMSDVEAIERRLQALDRAAQVARRTVHVFAQRGDASAQIRGSAADLAQRVVQGVEIRVELLESSRSARRRRRPRSPTSRARRSRFDSADRRSLRSSREPARASSASKGSPGKVRCPGGSTSSSLLSGKRSRAT